MLAYQYKNSYQIIVKSVNLDRDSSRTGRAGLLAEQPDKMGVRSVGYKNKIYWRTFSGYKSIEPIIFSRNEVGERQTLITFKVV